MTADAMHSGTPRTDAQIKLDPWTTVYQAHDLQKEPVTRFVDADFARQLETENAALIAALEYARRMMKPDSDFTFVDAALERARKGA